MGEAVDNWQCHFPLWSDIGTLLNPGEGGPAKLGMLSTLHPDLQGSSSVLWGALAPLMLYLVACGGTERNCSGRLSSAVFWRQQALLVPSRMWAWFGLSGLSWKRLKCSHAEELGVKEAGYLISNYKIISLFLCISWAVVTAGVSALSLAANVEWSECALLSLGGWVTGRWLVLVQATCAHMDHRVRCLPEDWVSCAPIS